MSFIIELDDTTTLDHPLGDEAVRIDERRQRDVALGQGRLQFLRVHLTDSRLSIGEPEQVRQRCFLPDDLLLQPRSSAQNGDTDDT